MQKWRNTPLTSKKSNRNRKKATIPTNKSTNQCWTPEKEKTLKILIVVNVMKRRKILSKKESRGKNQIRSIAENVAKRKTNS